MRKTILIDIISALLLLLLLYTGVSKLMDFSNFYNALTKSPLLTPFAEFLAIALPVTEISIAILLFIPPTRVWGLFCSLILLIMLTTYLVYMVLFTSNLPCSCGGVIKDLNWQQHIFFNLFFILLATAGIYLSAKRKKPPTVAPT